MLRKNIPIMKTESAEQTEMTADKKKTFALFKKKEKDTTINLEKKTVKEFDGPFHLVKHKVTGKEFNEFVIETQNAIIKIKQDMTSFTGRVDGIGDDLEKIDERNNQVSEATVKALAQVVNEMQSKVQQVEEYKKSIKMYQMISIIAVVAAAAELILFVIK